MKELSENVKAIDVVKQMVADGQISQDVAENYFPELKESEDERMFKECSIAISASEMHTLDEKRKMEIWFKSLSSQNRWKPSKEQIIALRWVLGNVPYCQHKEEISGLLDQIKKL